MPKDSRLYANITHDFFESPKIMVLSDRAKLGLLEMILWSCRMQTDGVIDRRVASAKHLLDVCQELLDNDPETPSLLELENGDFLIHDFTEHQTTRAEIEAIREKRRAAGRAGGLAKSRAHAAKSSKRLASATASAKHGAKQTASKPLAKGVANSSKKKNKKGGGEQAENTANGVCQKHPLGNLTHEPCWGCADAKKQRAHAEAVAKVQRRAAIDSCTQCDDLGYVKVANGTVAKCTHPKKGPF